MSGDAKICDNSELTKVLEQIPEGVLVLDGDGVIQFANKLGARLVKLKPKTAVGSTFAHPIEDGTMRDFDVEMTVKEIPWAGTAARLIHLKSLKSSGAFHLEWKLEAALERAKEAEDALAALKAESEERPTKSTPISADASHYDERISELETLLELAEVRADELEEDIGRDDHQRAQELQDAISRVRETDEQLLRLEQEVDQSRERIRIAEEQAEVAEERAYSLEAELEEVLALQEESGPEQSDERLEQLQVQIEDLTGGLAASQARVSELESALTLASDEKTAALDELALQKEMLKGAQARFDANLSQSMEDGEQGEALQEQLAELNGRIVEAEKETLKLREELGSVEASRASLQAKTEGLESDLESRKEEVDKLAAAVEELEEQLETSAEESEELAEQLRLETEQFEQKLSKLQEQNEQLINDLMAAENAQEALLEELDGVTQISEERSVEASELQSQLASLETSSSECESLRKDVRRLENLLQNAEELAQKGERVGKLERKLEGALRRAEEAEERLMEERRLLNELKERADKFNQDSREGPIPAAEGANPETERLAFQDVLTGLPNRNIIQRYLGFMLKQSARYNRLTAMLRVDCDDFKTISDTFGVEIGDELIRSVGERLSSVVRGSDVLGRYGEDEFIMLLSEMVDKDEASVMTAAIIKRAYQKLKVPFTIGDQTITVGVSIGVSIYPLDATNGEQMFEHASVALKRAKETGRGHAQYFTPELQTNHVSRIQLDSELKTALDKDEFEMVYQPIFDLSNGQIVGVESLIRWRHPGRGVLEPQDFLQIAEDSGMIVLIGNWALRQALESAAQWNKMGLGIFVAVNLSRRQLLQADLLPSIQSALSELNCSPDRLLLEIPEQLTGQNFPKIRETLAQLQRLGIRLAVDNFGTASTSLQDLRRGPFQVLKVDRKFVRGVPADEENTGIVLSALTVGHHLGRLAVAVGVETEAEKIWLAKTGCRFAQGNFLSPPLVSDQISQFAKRT